MALLPVDEALARLLYGAVPLGSERVPLSRAAGRVLAAPVVALRTQPPFDASAMDGYAVRAADTEEPTSLAVIGEAVAGRRFDGRLGAGEAVRIFTGAPVPEGADSVLIQEDAEIRGEGRIEAREPVASGRNIRRAGLDFRDGQTLLDAGRVLDAGALSLAAAANHPALDVVRRPLVAILATGDELLLPGSDPGPDQIIASNAYGAAAIAAEGGADVIDLGIAPDRRDAIAEKLREAFEAGADVIVTLGGASVGDHDLVRAVLESEGVTLGFWKIAMRPGKPLMFGRRSETRVLGLPGNPVASLVCSHVFLKPLLARLGGLPYRPRLADGVFGVAVGANDHRQDFLRARVEEREGRLVALPFTVQDSSMLKTLADAEALVIRAPHARAAAAGEPCRMLLLR